MHVQVNEFLSTQSPKLVKSTPQTATTIPAKEKPVQASSPNTSGLRGARSELLRIWVALGRLDCVPQDTLPASDFQSLRVVKTILDSMVDGSSFMDGSVGDFMDWIEGRDVEAYADMIPSYKLVNFCVDKILSAPLLSVANRKAAEKKPAPAQPATKKLSTSKNVPLTSPSKKVEKPEEPESTSVPPPKEALPIAVPSEIAESVTAPAVAIRDASIVSSPQPTTVKPSVAAPSRPSKTAMAAAETRQPMTPRTTSRLATANRPEEDKHVQQPSYFPVSFQGPSSGTAVSGGLTFGKVSFGAPMSSELQPNIIVNAAAPSHDHRPPSWTGFGDSAILHAGPVKNASVAPISDTPAVETEKAVAVGSVPATTEVSSNEKPKYPYKKRSYNNGKPRRQSSSTDPSPEYSRPATHYPSRKENDYPRNVVNNGYSHSTDIQQKHGPQDAQPRPPRPYKKPFYRNGDSGNKVRSTNASAGQSVPVN